MKNHEKYCSMCDIRTYYSPKQYKFYTHTTSEAPQTWRLRKGCDTTDHKVERLVAKTMMCDDKNLEEQKNVVWCNKSSFTFFFPTNGRVYIGRIPRKAYEPDCIAQTNKHGGDSVMFGWQCSGILLVLSSLLMVELLLINISVLSMTVSL